MSPPEAGFTLMAQPVMMAALSPIAGRLADRIEPRLIASAGMAITSIGVAIFTQLGPATVKPFIVANLVLLGCGFALFSSPNMSAIMGAVEKKHYGVASGTVATMRLLGQMFSMAIATVALSLIVGHKAIRTDNYDKFLVSMHTVFMISATLCAIGIYFSWFRGAVLQKVDKPHH
jgi:MFS family permease